MTTFNSWIWLMAYDNFNGVVSVAFNNQDLLEIKTGTQGYVENVQFVDDPTNLELVEKTGDEIIINGSAFEIEDIGTWEGVVTYDDGAGHSGSVALDGSPGSRIIIYRWEDGGVDKFGFRFDDATVDLILADMTSNGVPTSTDPVTIITGVNTTTADQANAGDHPTADVDADSFNFAVCFAKGTKIATSVGNWPIENLKAGMKVKTIDGGTKRILWTGHSVWKTGEHASSKPVRIPAKSLGPNIPSSDLYVSQQHRVLIRNAAVSMIIGDYEAFVPAKKLVGYRGIELCDHIEEVEYYHVLLTEHTALLSNGAESESFFPGPTAVAALPNASLSAISQVMMETGINFASYQLAFEEIRKNADVKKLLRISARLGISLVSQKSNNWSRESAMFPNGSLSARPYVGKGPIRRIAPPPEFA